MDEELGARHDLSTSVAHPSDALMELDDLSQLYRSRAQGRTPVHQRSLSPLERRLRKQVAGSVLTHLLPALVAELLDAASDDLIPIAPDDSPSTLEAQADADLRVVEAVERCKAVLDAVGLEALARLHATIESGELGRFADLGCPKPSGWIDCDELTAMEMSTATGLGMQEARARIDLATARTPGAAELRARLQHGSVSLHRACTIQDEIHSLPAECGTSVVDAVLRPKDGAPPSPTLFRQRLTRACLAADREAAERRRSARRRRGAHALIDSDGLGVLTVVNDADKILAAMERADSVARAARQAGGPPDLHSLRADVIPDTLMFGWPETGLAGPATASPLTGAADVCRSDSEWFTRLGRRPAATVTVVVPFTTAVGLTDAPCEVPGYGWVAADHARQIILNDDSTWRRLAVDADTGAAIHVETQAYRPTAAMRAHVEAVDGTCRAPGCTVSAARCDLDHDIPWPHGPTEVTNLTSKHRPHHNTHTHGHWLVHRAGDRVRWRTKAGRVYDTSPKDWLEGVRDSRGAAAARPRPVDPPVAQAVPPPF